VRHEIVHNTYVVERPAAKGAVFIEDLADGAAGPRWSSAPTACRKAVREARRARGFRVSSTPPARW
jgi:4-hydroxy-3-methylbut-2-enyl diphosphate reductase IspH